MFVLIFHDLLSTDIIPDHKFEF